MFKVLFTTWFWLFALDAHGQYGDAFYFGESCELLWEVHAEDLAELTHAANFESFSRFCVPEWPSRCADYSGLVSDFGWMKMGEDSYHCQFVAHEEADNGYYRVR